MCVRTCVRMCTVRGNGENETRILFMRKIRTQLHAGFQQATESGRQGMASSLLWSQSSSHKNGVMYFDFLLAHTQGLNASTIDMKNVQVF